jgi:Pvc16 N-terminal domain/Carboxypeptidase regulatory-like domain
MIRYLSETLKAVLQDPGLAIQFPELAGADVLFDRPLDTFNPAKLTVNLFLYDVRENTELRSNEFDVEIKNGLAISHPAALRLNCSYLVTAWATAGPDLPLQEHRLLTQVLTVLSRYPTIPGQFLKGSLVGQFPPLPMVALHPDALKNLAEFWSSLGSKLRASLTVTATISVPVFTDVDDFLVTTHMTNYVHGAPPVVETLIQVGGRVLDNTKQGIAGALVDLMDGGEIVLRTTSNNDGEFDFAEVVAGTHTVRVAATGFQLQTQPFTVPAKSEDYVVTLTPL